MNMPQLQQCRCSRVVGRWLWLSKLRVQSCASWRSVTSIPLTRSANICFQKNFLDRCNVANGYISTLRMSPISFLLGVGWDWVHLVRRRLFGLTVPTPDCGCWWVWSSRWNENWQGKPKYLGKTCPSAALSTTNPTWLDLGSNRGRRGGKPTTNSLSYGTAMSRINITFCGQPNHASPVIVCSVSTRVTSGHGIILMLSANVDIKSVLELEFVLE
jgi:hypothetical protein